MHRGGLLQITAVENGFVQSFSECVAPEYERIQRAMRQHYVRNAVRLRVVRCGDRAETIKRVNMNEMVCGNVSSQGGGQRQGHGIVAVGKYGKVGDFRARLI